MSLFAPRYLPLIASALVFPLAAWWAWRGDGAAWWVAAVSGVLTAVGVSDLLQ